MTYETSMPSVSTFIQGNGGFLSTILLYLKQFGLALTEAYLQCLPLSTPEYQWVMVANLCLLVVGLLRLFQKGFGRALFMCAFFFSLLFLMSMAAVGLGQGGRLHARHFTTFIPFVALLWALGLEVVLSQLKRGITIPPGIRTFLPRLKNADLVFGLALLTIFSFVWVESFRYWKAYDLAGKKKSPFTEIYAFHWFWSHQDPELEDAARWIKAHTSKDATFMYGSTPQDFWGLTHRKVIIDPVYAGGSPTRACEEAKFYHVEFLVLDASQSVYARTAPPQDLPKAYPGLAFSEVWKNSSSSIVIYKIAPQADCPRL
jgi:hypothetical protein